MSGAAFVIHAGPRALRHVRTQGLRASDIACVPAAAGGPKGLALIALDKWLFGEWLRNNARLELVGASIGAWRMYAAAQRDPVPALDRLAEAYLSQHLPQPPTPAMVAAECRRFIERVTAAEGTAALRSDLTLSVITARARGVLQASSSRSAFARAAASNLRSRRALAAHAERVLFTHGESAMPAAAFDAFGATRVPLTDANLQDALLASGSLPLICEPVRNPADAPRGDYWDGGLIDYHVLLPYQTLEGLVLYPHFVPHITPGWLDKFLPWRLRARGHAWLDNVLLISPSPAFLHTLPGARLPDRKDFYRYGIDNSTRIRIWRSAIAQCQRFADEVAQWLLRPDPSVLLPI